MRIRHTEIGKDGLHIATSSKAEWLTNMPDAALNERDARIVSVIDLDIQVTKVLKEVTVSGVMSFSIESPCARCLAPVELTLSPEVNLVLSPKEASDGDEAKSDEYVDFETYSGDEIDLGGYLREVVAMSLPVKVVCAEDCAGLCQCGADLNFEACSCSGYWEDSRFSALKSLKV
ncbi:MAG: YceD family protein [Deltaproteobacteria bacterium]